MTHIPIPITKTAASVHPGTLITSLFGVFVLGMILGVLSTNATRLVSGVSTESTLAGVGAVIANDESENNALEKEMLVASKVEADADAPIGDNDLGLLENSLMAQDADPIITVAAEGEVRGAETLAVAAGTQEAVSATRERLTSEIKLIKDTSVTLIVEFRQNCGVWTDACAVPYQTQLEKNNSRYEELERALRELE